MRHQKCPEDSCLKKEMAMEMLLMSAKERKRLEVFGRVQVDISDH